MLTTIIIEIARTITALQEALRAETAQTAKLRAEKARSDHELEQLRDLTRRQALFIKNLVNESRGESYAAEVTALRIENDHLLKKLDATQIAKAS